MLIGQRIKQLRKELELSQTEFAENINLKQTAIGMVENGKRRATDRIIADVCRVYSCSENWLRTGEGSMFEERTKEEELAAWAGKTLSCDDSNFKKRFLVALSKLDEDDWKTVEKICRLVLEDENEKPQ